jgi:predicted TPR repeat methyltransferase
MKSSKANQDGEFINVRFQQASLLFQNGQFIQAEKVCKAILKGAANYSNAYHLLGLIYYRKQKLLKATKWLSKALDYNPTNSEIYFNLASIYQHKTQYQQATHHYKQAIKYKPDFWQAYFNIGTIFSIQDETENAIHAFQKTLEINPEYPEALYNLGNSLQSIKDLKSAEKIYCQLLKQQPKNTKVLNNLGVIYQQKRDLAKAIYYLQYSLDVDPNNIEAHNNLGTIMLLQGKLSEAKEHLQVALKLNPAHTEALVNLGNVYRCEESFPQAHECLDKVLQLEPAHSKASIIKSILENKTPSKLPEEYIQGLFDLYSCTFEEHLVNKLDYRVPAILANILKNYLNTDLNTVLDLGCGTGLVGRQLNNFFKINKLVGVDISEKMLLIANEKGGYDELVNNDIMRYLKKCTQKQSLIVAADVFIYIGKLDSCFQKVAPLLEDLGIFAFSIEPTTKKDICLANTGRYEHSYKYIVNLAAHYELKVLHEEDILIRNENDQAVKGKCFCLQKNVFTSS